MPFPFRTIQMYVNAGGMFDEVQESIFTSTDKCNSYSRQTTHINMLAYIFAGDILFLCFDGL